MTNPSVIDNMDGHQFEYYCAELLKRNGYHNVRVTPGSGDNGVDILAERDGISFAIQCKCYSRNLGNKAVQEVFSGRTFYNCDEAVVLTNSFFTEPAKEAARRTGVILWDRDTLLALDRVAYPSNAAYGHQQIASSNANKRSSRVPIIIAIILIGILFSHCGNTGSGKKEDTNEQNEIYPQINAQETWVYPELDDFEYSFQSYPTKSIVLEEYKGNATSIIIPESYEVEGFILPVTELDGTFRKGNLVNLIIPEGVAHIKFSTFFKTKTLKHIYIPASLSYSNDLLTQFPNGEILYYGGTEEQWHRFCDTTPRSKIGFKRIYYNSSPEDCIANIDTIVNDSPNTTTGANYIPLTEFEYDVYKNEITLLRYTGKEQSVIIAPEYNVNGEICQVRELGDGLFLHNVDTVIIPEGVTTLSTATFNSSDAKTIYFPASINGFPKGFWQYLHDVDTIYYGGSEEDFKKNSIVDRWSIDVKHMIYNASSSDVPQE